METGIEIIADATWGRKKKILINNEYKNLIFSRKIKLTDCTKIGTKKICLNPWHNITGMDMYSETAIMGNADVLQLPLTSDDLLIAATVDYSVPADKNQLGGSVYSWGRFKGAKCVYVPQGSNVDNIYIYIYNLIPTRASKDSTCGIQIFNATEQIVYDSNEHYLNIVKANFWGLNGKRIYARDLKDGRKYAMLLPFLSTMLITGADAEPQWALYAHYYSDGDAELYVRARQREYNEYGYERYGYYGTDTDMIIDVSNL